MSIVKHLAEDNFIKVDNELLKLSKNAYWVYGHFCNQHPGKDPNDSYMQEITKMSYATYFNAKKELRNKDYLYVQQVGKKDYIYHIGKLAVMKIKAKK